MAPGIKKSVWAAGMILLLAMPSAAQLRYGVRAGIARSWMIQKQDLDYRSGAHLGYSLGVFANIPVYRRFSFRPEIAFCQQGGYFYSLFDENWTPSTRYSANVRTLQVPLDIAFNIPISGVRLSIFGGVAPDIRLAGKMKVRNLGENPAPTTEINPKSFDLGVNWGLSVEVKNVMFSINMLLGTMDRRIDKREGESSVYQNNLSFSLGYMLR